MPKLEPLLSRVVAKNVRSLLKARGLKTQSIAAEVVGPNNPRELHNYLRRLRPRIRAKRGDRVFCWEDLPALARVLNVSQARLLWDGKREYHTGPLRSPPGVTLTTPERRQVEDAANARRQTPGGGDGKRRLFPWPGKRDQPDWAHLEEDPRTLGAEREAEEFARVLREKWQVGPHPIASLFWLFEAAGGVYLTLDRPGDTTWPGLLPFFYNSDRVVVATADFASLPAARQRYHWARAFGWFVTVDFITKIEPLDRFARAFLLPKALREECTRIRREPAKLGEVAEIFGVDAETLAWRLDDWGLILNERQRLKVQSSLEKLRG